MGKPFVGRAINRRKRYEENPEFRKKKINQTKKYSKEHRKELNQKQRARIKLLSEFKNKRCNKCLKILDYRTKGKLCFKCKNGKNKNTNN